MWAIHYWMTSTRARGQNFIKTLTFTMSTLLHSNVWPYEGKFYRSSWSCYYYYYWSILETKASDCYTCSFGSSCLSSLSNCGLRGEESSAFSRSPWYQNSSATSPAIWNNVLKLNFRHFSPGDPERKVFIFTPARHLVYCIVDEAISSSLLRTFRVLVSKCFYPLLVFPRLCTSPQVTGSHQSGANNLNALLRRTNLVCNV